MSAGPRREAAPARAAAGALGGVLLAVSCIGWWLAPRLFLAAWLAAWWWTLGLVLGTFVNAWMHRLTGGAWGEALRAPASTLGARAPWLLPLLLPVVAGLRVLYPWAAEPAGAAWTEGIAHPGFIRGWFALPFFGLRLAVYALAWWWVMRPASLRRKARAAASLIVYALVTTLAALDLLMSLLPGWRSTAFGLVAMSAQALSGAALAVLAAARQRAAPAAARAPGGWRDLGNLLLMWSMSWAYLAFMEFLVIWAENLPREIAWLVPRLHTGWRAAAVVLVLAQFALPCLALLFRAVKDRPARLAGVAALLLAATLLDAAWIVVPSVDAHGLQGLWMLPLMGAGMALLVVGDPRRWSAPGGPIGPSTDRDADAIAKEWGHARP